MAKGPTYSVKFRRRREGKTNYRKRLKLLLSKKPRLVIRKTNRYIIAHIVKFNPKGDETILMVNSKILRKLGWPYSCKCLPASYLTGYLLGKLYKKKEIGEVILDIGLSRLTKGNRIFACYKGFLDAGGVSPHSPKYFPSEERIKGEHIAKYAKLLKEKDIEAYKKIFSGYLKEGAYPEDIPKKFQEIKEKIDKEYGG